MKVENLRSLIRESIAEYIKEIDNAANEAADNARITKCAEEIQKRESRLENLRNLEEAADMLDETKVKAIENEIKELKKAKAKFEKIAEKKAAKKAKKSAPKEEEDVVTDAVTEEAPIDETDIAAEMELEEAKKKDKKKEEDEKEMMNESFIRMQKIAGLIK